MQSNNDPRQTLRVVRAAAASVTRLGSDDVRGATATHYRAHILLDRYPAAFPPAQHEAARRAMATMRAKFGMRDYDIDLWIGPDKFVHRMSFALTIKASAAGTAKMAVTMDMYDFNVPADIALPKVS
jgi:hypothetical protein